MWLDSTKSLFCVDSIKVIMYKNKNNSLASKDTDAWYIFLYLIKIYSNYLLLIILLVKYVLVLGNSQSRTNWGRCFYIWGIGFGSFYKTVILSYYSEVCRVGGDAPTCSARRCFWEFALAPLQFLPHCMPIFCLTTQ